MGRLPSWTLATIAFATVVALGAIPGTADAGDVALAIQGFPSIQIATRDARGVVTTEMVADEDGDGVIELVLDAGEEVGVQAVSDSRTYTLTVTPPEGSVAPLAPARIPLLSSESTSGESLVTRLAFDTGGRGAGPGGLAPRSGRGFPELEIGQPVDVMDGTIVEWPALEIGDCTGLGLYELMHPIRPEGFYDGPASVLALVDVTFLPEPAQGGLAALALLALLARSGRRRRSRPPAGSGPRQRLQLAQ